MVVGLIVVGIAFIVLAVWLIRQTRYDLPVLAPLERMGDKDWRRQSDPATQRRILDEVRPEGAEPLRSQSSPPSLDAEFELADRPVASMSDLAPPIAEGRSATPHGLDRPDMLDFDLDSTEPEEPAEPAEPAEPEEPAEPDEPEEPAEPEEPDEGPVEESDESSAEGEPAEAERPVEESEETSMPVSEESADGAAEEESDASAAGSPPDQDDEPVDDAAQGSTDAPER